jgi:hypothetical protein
LRSSWAWTVLRTASDLAPPSHPTHLYWSVVLSLATHLAADLQDIGDLEGYVRATGVILFFLSKNYFTSRNCLASRGQGLDRGEAATGAGARAAGGQGRRAASNDADGDSAARRCASTSSMGARQSRGTASRTIPEPHAQIHCHRDAPARPQVYDDSLHSSSSQLLHSSSSQLANVIAAAHCHSSRNSSRRDELSSSERVSRRSSLVQWLAVQEAKPLAVQEEETSAAVKVQAVVRGTSTRQMSLGALVPGKVLSLVLPGEVNIAELALHNDLLCSGVALATLARRQWLTS